MKSKFLVAAALISMSGLANATPVNGTGLVTPDVIFGSGNANGSWTGATGGAIEVALRGKLRYDLAGNPQNIFNYDGDRTYTFDPANSLAPLNRSIFNFEFSVNSDTGGTSNRNVNDIAWLLQVDVDPSAAVFNAFSGDPINGFPYADHAFGNNSTGNGGGLVADLTIAGQYDLFRISNNVAQNSSNLGFGFTPNPQTPGIYTFTLSGSDSTGVLASTSIDVIVLAQAVPAPASLGLLAMGFLALVLRGRRSSAKTV